MLRQPQTVGRCGAIGGETVDIQNIDWQAVDQMSGTQVKKLLELLEPKSLRYSPHKPTPKQQAFMNLTQREAFFGGAAGGGKSDALLMDALQYSDVKGYAAIIFRKSFADLTKPGALIDRAKEWLLPHSNVVWKEKDRKFEFQEKYGRHTDITSILQFGYLENEGDRYNYQGGEYQYIGFDELVHMSEANYRYMFSRLRRLKHVQIPMKMRGASNPPDDSQGKWVYDRFVNQETKKSTSIFIPAGMDDNPYLDKEEYSKALDELDPVSRARLKQGIWTITRKGNMFKRDWFEVVDELPPNRQIVRFWDMAATDPEKAKRKHGEPDYSVGAKVSEYKGTYYIEDIERFQCAPGESQKRQQETAARDTKKVRIRMEQEPGSSGIITIDHYKENVFKGYFFDGVRSTGNKVERANPMSAKAEKGIIKIYMHCRIIVGFLDESESFPGGAHDDIVDSVSGAVAELSAHVPRYDCIPTLVGEGASYWNGLDIM